MWLEHLLSGDLVWPVCYSLLFKSYLAASEEQTAIRRAKELLEIEIEIVKKEI